ncbi:hypothetical protein LIL_12547 [Leptospira interrogans serovar Linhai str. 56609]|nr:hypothetical protein LIL_12547 [Leptospira interrogans serovar Linhai str. 56609]
MWELPQTGDLPSYSNLWELPQNGSDHPDNTKISIGILNSIRYLKRGFLEFL